MSIKNISFPNVAGHQLSAIIELPELNKPMGYALFAHCFTCNKNLAAIRNMANSLTDNGIAVLLFDFTGPTLWFVSPRTKDYSQLEFKKQELLGPAS